tara:strand:- start:811 stop:2052 length:1242 start_codon:yes stop_codon:yes gene_type:complete
MTDYIAGLNRARQNYIDSRTGKDTGVSLAVGGLGAPTPKKVVEKVAEETDNVYAKAHSRIYESDDANYAGEAFKYELQAGDTLSELALKHGMTVPEIMKLNVDNPAIKTKDLIYAGGTINLTRPKDTEVVSVDDRFESSNVDVIMNDLSEKYNLPFKFIKAVAKQESGIEYRKGALDEEGIMQVRPIALKDINKYYKEFKGNPITIEQLTKGSGSYNIQRSIEAGVAYLAMLRDRYGAKNLKEIATMYNGGPNAVRSGNKKANSYANSVMGLMESIEPFKFKSFKGDDKVESFDMPDAFQGSQEMNTLVNVKNLGLSVDLTNELSNLQKEINNSLQMDDSDGIKKRIKKALEDTYEFLADLDTKQPTYEDTTTFEERVRKSFPEDSKFVDRILDDKTEQQKQSIVSRPKRFVQ